MRHYKIALIGGDGIGPEVVAAGREVLDVAAARAGFTLDFDSFDWGADYYRRHGVMMPADGVARLRDYQAIYFGAVGDPEIPDHVTLWGLRLAICQGLDQYVNLRPTRRLKGVRSPLRDALADAIDWVIVRENSEGEYAGTGGRVHRDQPLEVAIDAAVFTRAGCERVQRYAFEAARARPRRHLTLVTKSNAQRHGMVLWDEVFDGLKADYPEVTTDRVLVDAATARMTLDPASLDVIVASNLHADILSDLAAALAGSLGVAATGNLDPTGKSPSMFEPIHGTAPDIVGKGIANPIGAFWTAAMMLDHLGEGAAAARIMAAIERIAADGSVLTPDLGGRATTREVTDAMLNALRGAND